MLDTKIIEKSAKEVDLVVEICECLVDAASGIHLLNMARGWSGEEREVFDIWSGRVDISQPYIERRNPAIRKAVKRVWIIRKSFEFYNVCSYLMATGHHPIREDEGVEPLEDTLKQAGWDSIAIFVIWYEDRHHIG